MAPRPQAQEPNPLSALSLVPVWRLAESRMSLPPHPIPLVARGVAVVVVSRSLVVVWMEWSGIGFRWDDKKREWTAIFAWPSICLICHIGVLWLTAIENPWSCELQKSAPGFQVILYPRNWEILGWPRSSASYAQHCHSSLMTFRVHNMKYIWSPDVILTSTQISNFRSTASRVQVTSRAQHSLSSFRKEIIFLQHALLHYKRPCEDLGKPKSYQSMQNLHYNPIRYWKPDSFHAKINSTEKSFFLCLCTLWCNANMKYASWYALSRIKRKMLCSDLSEANAENTHCVLLM